MADLSFTAIDVLVVAIVLISAGVAMFRGLIHETFSILEWVAGLYVALRFTPVFQPLLNGVISPPWLEWAAVFIGCFLLVFIPLSIMSHRLSEIVKKSDIGPVDRTLGFVFGVARGLVIVGLAYIAFDALVPAKSRPETLTKARLLPLIRNTSDVLRSIGPSQDENSGTTASESSNDSAANSASEKDQSSPAAKTYGAGDRGALDRLFQTNGGSGSSSK